MANQNKAKQGQYKPTGKPGGKPAGNQAAKSFKAPLDKRSVFILSLIVALTGFLLYSGTFGHKYVLDDYPTVKENKLTQKGIHGIPEIYKHSYWYGNDGKDDWLYRPLSVSVFALEWEIWPDNPKPSHIINVLLYALTGMLLFYTLRKLFIRQNILIPFVSSLLFMAHPLHTEVVANIKSLDEILTFLFFLVSLHLLLDYSRKGNLFLLAVSLVSFFLSLMAKESAITYLFMFPLALYYYTEFPLKKLVITMGFFGVVAATYMLIRGHVLTSQTLGSVVSIIDNTVVKSDYLHRFATAIVILVVYIKLLLFPHPLVYDYSFNTFEIVGLNDRWALLSILIYAGMGYYVLRNFLKKDTIVFSIVLYIIPVILVSNIFFLTRSTAAERFLYQPSLGYAIVVALLLSRLFKADLLRTNFQGLRSFFKTYSRVIAVTVVILACYSFKTFHRAAVWKDNITLFKTDLQNIPKSARAQYSYANDLTQSLVKDSIKTKTQQDQAYAEALEGLNKALKIYSDYFEPYFALGQLAAYKKDYGKSIEIYKKAMTLNKDYHFLYNNIGNNYFRMGQLDSALKYLHIAISMKADYAEAYGNIGSVYFTQGKQKEALEAYERAIQMDPRYYDAYKNLGSTYGMLKDYNKAMENFFKALKLKSSDADLYGFIGMTYGFMGDKANEKAYNDKAAQIRADRGR
jgi:tetratricopeptide (TPR) repeat protein